MAWHKKPKTNLTKLRFVRMIVQITMFFLLNLVFFEIGANWLVLPINMPQTIFSSSEGSFFLLQRMLSQAIMPLIPLASFLIIGGIFGRLFCAWACPFGLFQDIIGLITSWIKKYEPTHSTNTSMRQIGELVTGGTLLISTFIGISVGLGNQADVEAAFGSFFEQPWAVLSPAVFLFTAIPVMVYWGVLGEFFRIENLGSIDILLWIRLVVFIVAIIMIIYIPRGWCRWICPVGIIMGRLGEHSLIGVGRNITKCNHCGLCEDVCPMGVQILSHPAERVRSVHCTNCLDCIAICDEDAMELKIL